MHQANKNKDMQDSDAFEQKDLGSEFESLDANDFVLSIKNQEIIKLYPSEEQFDTTYLFIGGGDNLKSILDKKNVFNDQDSLVAGRTAIVSTVIPSGKDVIPFAEVVLEHLEKLSLKRITLIGFNEGANLVQALTILSPRLFRKAILVDPMSRVNPTLLTKIIDYIEKYLPVGLPFRASSKDFDSRPFLHRIRCPIMVLKTSGSSYYNQYESDYIASKIPNCYIISLKEMLLSGQAARFSNEFLSLIKDFNESPVKRPQKNL